MATFNALSKSKPKMVEQINDNVFRVHRHDWSHNSEAVLDSIHKTLGDHHSCIIVTSRNKAYLNGSGKLIENIENDYRSHYLIVVNRHKSQSVTYNDHQFAVVIDRYNKLVSVNEPEHGIELITLPQVCNGILGQYSGQCGNIEHHA